MSINVQVGTEIKEQFITWKSSPITKIVDAVTKQKMEYIISQLVSGLHLNDPAKMGLLVGKYQALADSLEISYDEVQSE